MDDKINLLFQVHKVFFDFEFSSIEEREKFSSLLLHWELCKNRNECTFCNCQKLSGLIKHYDDCKDDLCSICSPTRWLALKSRIERVRLLVQ